MAQRRYERLIAGDTRGVSASAARLALRCAGRLYGLAVGARNRLYDAGLRRVVTVSVPVISVGNLTVGGTGKTPFVIRLCEQLSATGRRVAVLARGYGAQRGGPNDELRLIQRRCPDVTCIADADRARAAQRAVAEHGAEVLVLDDGFQHRRLARNLDIVLVDARCPFGHGRMLPGGLLREPASGLRRADLVVVTHSDAIDEAAGDALCAEVRRLGGPAAVLRCRHEAVALVGANGEPCPNRPARGARVACVAGIAQPAGFERTVRELGYDPVAFRAWPDHHAYTAGDAAAIAAMAADAQAEVILTTEKDWGKLMALEPVWPIPMFAVRIAIDFAPGDATMLTSHVDACLAG